jgi:amphi-Trp domain-containing protein
MKIHKDERILTRAEAASELRRLADELESGAISYGSGESLVVPDRLEFEFEIEREERGSAVKFEVEVELEWSATA